MYHMLAFTISLLLTRQTYSLSLDASTPWPLLAPAPRSSPLLVATCLSAHRQQLPRKRASLADDKDKYLEGVAKMTDMTARLKRLQDEIAALQPRLQVSKHGK
jgi:hypothetical protein